MNNFAKLDPLGYIGITPNENYAYKIFSQNKSTQPYLIKFDLNGKTLNYFLEGKTSDFKAEGYGRSFGLGERGTNYLAGTAATGRPGDHFFNAIKNGEISVSLIGVKSCLD
ncbi:hypothetical protein CQJ27_26055 [Escherichia sp. E1130]|nr:hypothetical protein CQJ27_26055 [Escherichia sp. E1130]